MNAALTILKETFLILTPALMLYAIPPTWWGVLLAIFLLAASLNQAMKAIGGPKGHLYQGAGVGIAIGAFIIAVMIWLWPPIWLRLPVYGLVLFFLYTSYTILQRNNVPFFLWIKIGRHQYIV